MRKERSSIKISHSQLVDRIVAKYELQDGIREIGLFENRREVYSWHNCELELDYTTVCVSYGVQLILIRI